MKNFFLFVFCFLVVAFQVSVLGNFFGQNQAPDLVLGFAMTLILSKKFEDTIVWLVVLGILVDSFSRTYLGTTSLVLIALALLFVRLLRFAEIRSRRTMFFVLFGVIIFFSKTMFDVFSYVFFSLTSYFGKGEPVLLPVSLSGDYFLKILLTVCSAYAIYYVYRKSERALFIEPVKVGR